MAVIMNRDIINYTENGESKTAEVYNAKGAEQNFRYLCK